MTKQNYVILGIILIIVLVLAGAVLVREKRQSAVTPAPISQPPVITPTPPIVTPPTTPTSPTPQPPTAKAPEGWKTYENKEFGFTFDYPGDWEVMVKEIDRGRKEPQSYFTIYLWAPDQRDEQLRREFGPRIIIYVSRYEGTEVEKQKIKDFSGFQGTVEKIELPSRLEAYFLKSTLESVNILFTNVSVSIIAQQDTSLNMDIVNTFRLIGKSD